MDTRGLTIDCLYEVLSDASRRALLWTLVDRSPDARLSVPEDLPATATDGHPSRVQFHHVHLPKLRQYDLVSWDGESETVARGPAFAQVEPFLTTLRRHERQIGLSGAA